MDNEEPLQTQMQKLISEERWEEARDTIYTLLARQPESSWLHCNMGSVLYRLHDLHNAEIHLKTAIAQDPNYSDAFNYLSWVYKALGRWGTADDYNKMALSLDPKEPNNLILGIHLALSYDDIPQAERHLKVLEQVIPEGPEITAQRTAILSHPKNKKALDVEKQLTTLKESLTNDPSAPSHAVAYAQIAELHLRYTRDYREAQTYIKKAIQLEPRNQGFLHLYTRIMKKKNLFIHIISAPLSLFSNTDKENQNDFLLITFMISFAIMGSTLPPQYLPIFKQSVAIFIGLFILVYPIIKLYEYLTLTQIHHQLHLTQNLKGPLRKIHLLSFSKRLLIFGAIIVMLWICIGLFFLNILGK